MTIPHAPVAHAAWVSTTSRRVNAERFALLGWGRAILLQLAHPLVAAGVFDHSGFRATPWAAAARLRHTVQAMLSLTFGNDDKRARTIEAIRAVHRRVHGTLPEAVGPYPAGTPYTAEDPTLVLWVHATLLESVLIAYEQLVAPLTAADRDTYCLEAFPVAVALKAREAEVPRTWADVQDYLRRMQASGTILVSGQARELTRAVLSPSGAWMAAPATWVNRTVTVGLLPAWVRDDYGFAWSPEHERRFMRTLATLQATRRWLPDRLACWPQSRT